MRWVFTCNTYQSELWRSRKRRPPPNALKFRAANADNWVEALVHPQLQWPLLSRAGRHSSCTHQSSPALGLVDSPGPLGVLDPGRAALGCGGRLAFIHELPVRGLLGNSAQPRSHRPIGPGLWEVGWVLRVIPSRPLAPKRSSRKPAVSGANTQESVFATGTPLDIVVGSH